MAKLSFTDLMPEEFDIELSKFPGQKFTLGTFDLAQQINAERRFGGPKGLQLMFKNQHVTEFAELAHQLLKDKTVFPTFMDFAKAIVSPQDKISVVRALLSSVGITKPLILRVAKEVEDESPKTEAPAASQPAPTGAELLTSSPPNTAGT